MDDRAQRLLIASRIHHALLRHFGSGIDVATMLTNDDYAREALYVCAGCGDEELQSLGRQFELLRDAAAAPAAWPEAEDDGLEPMGSAPVDLDPLPPPRPIDRWLLRARRLLRRPLR